MGGEDEKKKKEEEENRKRRTMNITDSSNGGTNNKLTPTLNMLAKGPLETIFIYVNIIHFYKIKTFNMP